MSEWNAGGDPIADRWKTAGQNLFGRCCRCPGLPAFSFPVVVVIELVMIGSERLTTASTLLHSDLLYLVGNQQSCTKCSS